MTWSYVFQKLNLNILREQFIRRGDAQCFVLPNHIFIRECLTAKSDWYYPFGFGGFVIQGS